MKKLNLTSACAGCALCMILMVGATTELQPCYTDASDFPVEANTATTIASAVATGEEDVADALEFAQVAEEAEEQARAEAEAAQKAAEEAAAAAEVEKKAAEEAAAKAPSAKSAPV